MKRKFQYKAGERILNKAGNNNYFSLKMAEEIAGEIARKLFSVWNWANSFREIYAPIGLESLANRWLGINATPAYAFARVVEVDYRGQSSK